MRLFIHAFNHRLGSIRRDLQELRAEKFSPRFQGNGSDGIRDHCIATDFVISLAKLDHGQEGRLHVVGTMESDSISAFVY